jgi:hypothetical protein
MKRTRSQGKGVLVGGEIVTVGLGGMGVRVGTEIGNKVAVGLSVIAGGDTVLP